MDENNQENQNEEYDEGENLAFLPADHPSLKRFQDALTIQLTEEHRRVDEDLIQKEENLKRIDRFKEDLGVQLYGVQQQLADNQQKFEQAHENYNLVQKLRIDAEQKHNVVSDQFELKKKNKNDLVKKYVKSQDELSKLNRTLRQIQNYIEEMDSAIKTTKRGTLKAEEKVVQQEKDKWKQDFLIDNMNEEIKKLTEQKTVSTAQLISQKEETKQAQEILKDAHLEMEKIIASKKNLLERWQKSLFSMQRRDNALQAIKDALKQQSELNIGLGNELMGLNNEIRKEAEIHDKNEMTNKKLEHEKDFLVQKKQELEDFQLKLQAQINLLTNSLQTTDQETKKVDTDVRNIDQQMREIEQNIMKLHTETKKLLETIIHSISEHKTIEKTAANLYKQARIIQMECEDKEVELENLINEFSRVSIDKLNTQSQIELLENKKKEVLKEKEDKEITVATYEVQIRQGHDLNEKKQHEVGRLNKQHDDLTAGAQNGETNTRGPLEAQKASLKRKIQQLSEHCDRLEKEWINKQTKLVNCNNKLVEVSDKVSDQSTKQTIMEQKKIRINNDYVSHNKEIKDIRNKFKSLQTEMNKLNDGLAVNIFLEEKYKNENTNNESEFIQTLKDLEKESIDLEVKIDQIREMKADLLSEIVEAERQILLWERKMHLEKEMQETLNPNFGQNELQDLKRDCHRMELRLEDIRKKQESVILEMERAVYKRETIQLKYQSKDQPKAGQKKLDKNAPSQITKQVQNLKNTLNTTIKNSKQLDQAIKLKQQELLQIEQDYENLNALYLNAEKETFDLNNHTMALKINKQCNLFKISEMQILAQKYEDIAANKVKYPYPENILAQKVLEEKQKCQQINQVLQKVQDENQHFQFLLQPLTEL